jgi:hypothetical protein
MRKIIDGVIYDTKKAKLIAESFPDCGFGKFTVNLYLTKGGRFFVAYGERGRRDYQCNSCQEECNQFFIKPISESEVLSWAEEHDRFEEIEKYLPAESLEEA